MLKQEPCPPSDAVSQKNRCAAGRSYSSVFARSTHCLTSILGVRLALLSEVNKCVTPREWLCSFLPHTGFYAPEAFIKLVERLESECNLSS